MNYVFINSPKRNGIINLLIEKIQVPKKIGTPIDHGGNVNHDQTRKKAIYGKPDHELETICYNVNYAATITGSPATVSGQADGHTVGQYKNTSTYRDKWNSP